MFDSRGESRPPWRHGRVLFVVVALVSAGFLIAIPQLMGVPSAGDVCNAGSFAERDELEAEKTRAALIIICGALLSFVAASVAFVTAVQRERRGGGGLMLVLGLVGLISFAIGAILAFITYAVIC